MHREKKVNEYILHGVRIADLCLYFEKDKALVLADLHLGTEESINREGVMIPRINFKEIKQRLEEKVFQQLKNKEISEIIINGDLKHEFGAVSEQEWREAIDMIEFLQKQCGKTVLLRGNHDAILGPLAKWHGLEILDEFFLPKSKALVLHGHEEPDKAKLKNARTLVIAHDHPAITLRQGAKSETYKCFMLGKWHGKHLVVMPSLNVITLGTNVMRESLLSPMLKSSLGNFEIWAVEDKPYYMGRLGGLA